MFSPMRKPLFKRGLSRTFHHVSARGLRRQSFAVTFLSGPVLSGFPHAPRYIKKQDLKLRPCFSFLPAGLADLFIERTLLQQSGPVNCQLITFFDVTCEALQDGKKRPRF
jgi:hypothetical protein